MTAREVIKQIEAVGLQIIPRGPEEAYIQAPLGLRQVEQLEALWPQLRWHWPEILKIIANRDEFEAAAATMRVFTSRTEQGSKNPAAVALGKLGGSKGGKIRAKNLSRKRRQEIGKKAAQARWGKRSTHFDT
jgi:hypothetical protein